MNFVIVNIRYMALPMFWSYLLYLKSMIELVTGKEEGSHLVQLAKAQHFCTHGMLYFVFILTTSHEKIKL